MKTLLLISLAALALAQDKTEYRLADKFVHANRAAGDAFQQLDEYCTGKGKRAGIRNDTRVWGCVAVPPAPPTPPAVQPAAPTPKQP